MSFGESAPYVPVRQRRASAEKKMNALRKKGHVILPVAIQGSEITKTFWGKAWCKHLEQLSDYESRLPRGRTYVCNGSICHLEIKQGHIHAMVSGADIYTVDIKVKPLAQPTWDELKKSCAGKISSMPELLQGQISDSVMQVMTEPSKGLFPQKRQIHFRCSCPDSANMCEHIAAVLYGVGARLDERPQDLFLLRAVDEKELVSVDLERPKTSKKSKTMLGDLAHISSMELDFEGELSDKASDEVKPAKNKKIIRRVENKAVKKAAEAKAKTSTKTTSKNTISVKKNSPPQKSVTAKTTPRQAAPSDHGINISRGIRASHIKKLRKAFEMELIDFALCIGKSSATVKQWEEKAGVLNLQQASRECLEKAFSMSKTQAWRQYRKQAKA